MRIFLLFYAVFCFLAAPALAEDAEAEAKLPLPRFVTIRSDLTHVRTGPSQDYPIKWTYKRAHLPVEVIQEYDAWRKIRDHDGSVGWVNKIMLSGKRAMLITDEAGVVAMSEADGGKEVAKLMKGVIALVDECKKDTCHAEFSGFDGWIPKNDSWGIYPHEIFN